MPNKTHRREHVSRASGLIKNYHDQKLDLSNKLSESNAKDLYSNVNAIRLSTSSEDIPSPSFIGGDDVNESGFKYMTRRIEVRSPVFNVPTYTPSSNLERARELMRTRSAGSASNHNSRDGNDRASKLTQRNSSLTRCQRITDSLTLPRSSRTREPFSSRLHLHQQSVTKTDVLCNGASNTAARFNSSENNIYQRDSNKYDTKTVSSDRTNGVAMDLSRKSNTNARISNYDESLMDFNKITNYSSNESYVTGEIISTNSIDDKLPPYSCINSDNKDDDDDDDDDEVEVTEEIVYLTENGSYLSIDPQKFNDDMPELEEETSSSHHFLLGQMLQSKESSKFQQSHGLKNEKHLSPQAKNNDVVDIDPKIQKKATLNGNIMERIDKIKHDLEQHHRSVSRSEQHVTPKYTYESVSTMKTASEKSQVDNNKIDAGRNCNNSCAYSTESTSTNNYNFVKDVCSKDDDDEEIMEFVRSSCHDSYVIFQHPDSLSGTNEKPATLPKPKTQSKKINTTVTKNSQEVNSNLINKRRKSYHGGECDNGVVKSQNIDMNGVQEKGSKDKRNSSNIDEVKLTDKGKKVQSPEKVRKNSVQAAIKNWEHMLTDDKKADQEMGSKTKNSSMSVFDRLSQPKHSPSKSSQELNPVSPKMYQNSKARSNSAAEISSLSKRRQSIPRSMHLNESRKDNIDLDSTQVSRSRGGSPTRRSIDCLNDKSIDTVPGYMRPTRRQLKTADDCLYDKSNPPKSENVSKSKPESQKPKVAAKPYRKTSAI